MGGIFTEWMHLRQQKMCWNIGEIRTNFRGL